MAKELPRWSPSRRWLEPDPEPGFPASGASYLVVDRFIQVFNEEATGALTELRDVIATQWRTRETWAEGETVVVEWARKWAVEVNFVVEAAINGLSGGPAGVPSDAEKRKTEPLVLINSLAEIYPFDIRGTETLRAPEWRIFLESETEFRQRVDAYVQNMNEAALAAGLEQEREVRAVDPLEHYRWFIWHQVNGETYDQIASRISERGGSVTPQSISQATRKISETLGIPLRAAPNRHSG